MIFGSPISDLYGVRARANNGPQIKEMRLCPFQNLRFMREVQEEGSPSHKTPAQMDGALPGGSKYPLFKVSGPKSHDGLGFWSDDPQTVGTWSL